MEQGRWLALGVALTLAVFLLACAFSTPSAPSQPNGVPAGAIPKHLPGNNTTTASMASPAIPACIGPPASVG